MKLLPALFLFLLVLPGIAKAGTLISLSPVEGNYNQNQINHALEEVSKNGGGTVYLQSGVYEVTGPIYIYSNTKLTGASGAVLKVSEDSDQWFKGSKGVISCKEAIKHVEIYGFEIDGNIKNLPKSYANSREDTAHDCQKLIILGGYSNEFSENISIHDMYFHDSFSDAIYLKYTKYAFCYDNVIKNCQHSGIFYSVCQYSSIFKNNIEGITSDCTRLDNCKNWLVYKNVFSSFDGDSHGAFKHGENSLQIGDASSSHGYNAVKPNYHTINGEVFDNVFSDPGLKAIWLHSGTDNVFIHNNEFIKCTGLETDGTRVVDISPTDDNTIKSPDIFRVLLRGFSFPMIETDLGASATVIYNNMSFDPHSLIEVEGDNLKLIKFEYAGNTTRYFIEKGIWAGDIGHIGSELYIPGNFRKDSLKITVYSEEGYQKVTDIKILDRKLSTASTINPDLFVFISVLAVIGISISRNIRRIFP